MSLKYDPEFFTHLEPILPALSSIRTVPVHDVDGRRLNTTRVFGSILEQIPDVPDVSITEHSIAVKGTNISVFQFQKNGPKTTPGSAVLHFHGGGMIMGGVQDQKKLIAQIVTQTNVPFFSVDYRLAPESRGTSLAEDCFAGLIWLHQNASTLNIDTLRIAVMGESAGGGLAAAVAIMARDRKLDPPLAKQILLAPMLDDRNATPFEELEPFALWSCDDNVTGWTAVLGDKVGTDEVSEYAAPARVTDMQGLPPAYIDVGELDIFRDEDMIYAHRLTKAKISTEFHLYAGVPHGFEMFGDQTAIGAGALENRYKAIRGI